MASHVTFLLRLSQALFLVVICLGAKPEAPEWPDDDNLVGHWVFDGSNGNDRSGKWGATSYINTADNANGLRIEKSSGRYASVNTYSGPSLAQRTLVVRITIDNTINKGGGIFLADASGKYDGLCLGNPLAQWHTCSNSASRVAPSVTSPVWGGNTEVELTMTQRTIYTGRTPTATETSLFVDGMLWNSGWTSSSAVVYDNSQKLWFGRAPHTPLDHIDGYLKEVHLYNRFFTESEIRVPVSADRESVNGLFASFKYTSVIRTNLRRFDRFKDICYRYGMHFAAFSTTAEANEYEELCRLEAKMFYPGIAHLKRTAGSDAIWEYMDGPKEGDTWCLTNGRALAANGCKVDLCPWDANEPSDQGIIGVSNIYLRSYYRNADSELRIDDVGFNQDYSFMCQKSEVTKEYGNYKSYARRKSFTYERAKMLCKAEGGWLATFPTAERWAVARQAMIPATGEYIAAAVDTKDEGVWVWDDGPMKGTVFYRDGSAVPCNQNGCFWGAGEPSNSGGKEHWMEVNPSGWNDQDSGKKGNAARKVGVICEFNTSFTQTVTNSIEPPSTPTDSRSLVPTPSPMQTRSNQPSESLSSSLSSTPSESTQESASASRSSTTSSSLTDSSTDSLTNSDSFTKSPTVTSSFQPSATLSVPPTPSQTTSQSAIVTESSPISQTVSAMRTVSITLTGNTHSAEVSNTATITRSASFTQSGPTRTATLDFFLASLANATSITALGFDERREQRLALAITGEWFDMAAARTHARADLAASSAFPAVPVHWCAHKNIETAGSPGCFGCITDQALGPTTNGTSTSDKIVQLLMRGNVTLEVVDSSSARLVFYPWGAIADIEGDRHLSLHINPGCFRRRRPFPPVNFTLTHTERIEGVPEDVKAATKVGGEVAAVVSGVGSPAIATQMSRSSIVLNLASCEPETDEPLDRSQTPLRFGLGSTPMAFYVGGATINHGVQWGITAALAIMGVIYARVTGVTVCEGFEVSRFPSLAAFPLMLLLEPTCMCATTVIVQLGGAYKVIGVFSLALCCILPIALFFYLRHNRDKIRFYECWNPEEYAQTPNVMRFFFGGAKWIDRDGPRTSGFTQRNRLLFADYAGDYYWFLCVEMVMSILCGILDGVKLGPGACNAVIVMLVVGFAGFLLIILKTRPFNVPFMLVFAVLITTLQLAAACCVAVKVFFEVERAQVVAEWIAMACMWLLIARTAYDIGPNAYRWYKGLLTMVGARKRSAYRPANIRGPEDGADALLKPGPDAGPNSYMFTEGLHTQLQELLNEDEKKDADLDDVLLSGEGDHYRSGLDDDIEMYPVDDDSLGVPSAVQTPLPDEWDEGEEAQDCDFTDAASEYSDISATEVDLPASSRRWLRSGAEVQKHRSELDLIMSGVVDDDHPHIEALRQRREARGSRIASSTMTVLTRVVEAAREQGNGATAALSTWLDRLTVLDTVANKRSPDGGRPTLLEASSASAAFHYGEDGPLIEPITLLTLQEVDSLSQALRDARAMEATIMLQRIAQWGHTHASSTTASGALDLTTQIRELREEIRTETAVLDTTADPNEADEAIWERDELGELLQQQLDHADVLAIVGEPVTQDPLQLSSHAAVKKLHRALMKDGSLGAAVLAALVKKSRKDVIGDSGAAKTRPKQDSTRTATSRLVAELDLDLHDANDDDVEAEVANPSVLLSGSPSGDELAADPVDDFLTDENDLGGPDAEPWDDHADDLLQGVGDDGSVLHGNVQQRDVDLL